MPVSYPAAAESTPGSEIHVPGKTPRIWCGNFGPLYPCNRPRNHSGRHAFIWWHMGGRVRAVWGDK